MKFLNGKIGLKILFLIVFTSIQGCIPSQKVTKNNVMTDFFHFQKSEVYDSSKWAVFLPGTGGLRIFKDTVHYYAMAEHMNEIGISVLLVDNAAAYKASRKKDLKKESDQILWTLEQALDWAIEKEFIDSESYGTLVGWSRAGMGAVPLANDPELLENLHIQAMVLFYPANPEEIKLHTSIPILVLTGGKDRIIKLDDILEHMISENVNIKVYDDAYHGFDVESLEKGKYYRYVPFLSKKIYLLKYDQEAAADAVVQWKKFMENND